MEYVGGACALQQCREDDVIDKNKAMGAMSRRMLL